MKDAMNPFSFVYTKENKKVAVIYPTLGKQTYTLQIVGGEERREFISLTDVSRFVREKFGAGCRILYSELN